MAAEFDNTGVITKATKDLCSVSPRINGKKAELSFGNGRLYTFGIQCEGDMTNILEVGMEVNLRYRYSRSRNKPYIVAVWIGNKPIITASEMQKTVYNQKGHLEQVIDNDNFVVRCNNLQSGVLINQKVLYRDGCPNTIVYVGETIVFDAFLSESPLPMETLYRATCAWIGETPGVVDRFGLDKNQSTKSKTARFFRTKVIYGTVVVIANNVVAFAQVEVKGKLEKVMLFRSSFNCDCGSIKDVVDVDQKLFMRLQIGMIFRGKTLWFATEAWTDTYQADGPGQSVCFNVQEDETGTWRNENDIVVDDRSGQSVVCSAQEEDATMEWRNWDDVSADDETGRSVDFRGQKEDATRARNWDDVSVDVETGQPVVFSAQKEDATRSWNNDNGVFVDYKPGRSNGYNAQEEVETRAGSNVNKVSVDETVQSVGYNAQDEVARRKLRNGNEFPFLRKGQINDLYSEGLWPKAKRGQPGAAPSAHENHVNMTGHRMSGGAYPASGYVLGGNISICPRTHAIPSAFPVTPVGLPVDNAGQPPVGWGNFAALNAQTATVIEAAKITTSTINSSHVFANHSGAVRNPGEFGRSFSIPEANSIFRGSGYHTIPHINTALSGTFTAPLTHPMCDVSPTAPQTNLLYGRNLSIPRCEQVGLCGNYKSSAGSYTYPHMGENISFLQKNSMAIGRLAGMLNNPVSTAVPRSNIFMNENQTCPVIATDCSTEQMTQFNANSRVLYSDNPLQGVIKKARIKDVRKMAVICYGSLRIGAQPCDIYVNGVRCTDEEFDRLVGPGQIFVKFEAIVTVHPYPPDYFLKDKLTHDATCVWVGLKPSLIAVASDMPEPDLSLLTAEDVLYFGSVEKFYLPNMALVRVEPENTTVCLHVAVLDCNSRPVLNSKAANCIANFVVWKQCIIFQIGCVVACPILLVAYNVWLTSRAQMREMIVLSKEMCLKKALVKKNYSEMNASIAFTESVAGNFDGSKNDTENIPEPTSDATLCNLAFESSENLSEIVSSTEGGSTDEVPCKSEHVSVQKLPVLVSCTGTSPRSGSLSTSESTDISTPWCDFAFESSENLPVTVTPTEVGPTVAIPCNSEPISVQNLPKLVSCTRTNPRNKSLSTSESTDIPTPWCDFGFKASENLPGMVTPTEGGPTFEIACDSESVSVQNLPVLSSCTQTNPRSGSPSTSGSSVSTDIPARRCSFSFEASEKVPGVVPSIKSGPEVESSCTSKPVSVQNVPRSGSCLTSESRPSTIDVLVPQTALRSKNVLFPKTSSLAGTSTKNKKSARHCFRGKLFVVNSKPRQIRPRLLNFSGTILAHPSSARRKVEYNLVHLFGVSSTLSYVQNVYDCNVLSTFERRCRTVKTRFDGECVSPKEGFIVKRMWLEGEPPGASVVRMRRIRPGRPQLLFDGSCRGIITSVPFHHIAVARVCGNAVLIPIGALRLNVEYSESERREFLSMNSFLSCGDNVILSEIRTKAYRPRINKNVCEKRSDQIPLYYVARACWKAENIPKTDSLRGEIEVPAKAQQCTWFDRWECAEFNRKEPVVKRHGCHYVDFVALNFNSITVSLDVFKDSKFFVDGEIVEAEEKDALEFSVVSLHIAHYNNPQLSKHPEKEFFVKWAWIGREPLPFEFLRDELVVPAGFVEKSGWEYIAVVDDFPLPTIAICTIGIVPVAILFPQWTNNSEGNKLQSNIQRGSKVVVKVQEKLIKGDNYVLAVNYSLCEKFFESIDVMICCNGAVTTLRGPAGTITPDGADVDVVFHLCSVLPEQYTRMSREERIQWFDYLNRVLKKGTKVYFSAAKEKKGANTVAKPYRAYQVWLA